MLRLGFYLSLSLGSNANGLILEKSPQQVPPRLVPLSLRCLSRPDDRAESIEIFTCRACPRQKEQLCHRQQLLLQGCDDYRATMLIYLGSRCSQVDINNLIS